MPNETLFTLTDSTPPTLAEVREDLEAGRLPTTPTRYPLERLGQQLSQLQPVLFRHREVFAQKGYPDVEHKLVTAYRLLAIAGAATAEHRGIASDTKTWTRRQAELRRVGIALRDAALGLALDAGQDPELFRVRFGDGDARRVLPSFGALEALLVEHGARLGSPVLVAELLERTREARAELADAELEQEMGKKDRLVPTGVRRQARNALYALLLHFSRTGRAVFWDDPQTQAQLSLKALREGRRRKALVRLGDDDDGE